MNTPDGREIAVEFVSSVYLVDDNRVIQCNVRDITVRRRAERELRQRDRAIQASTRRGSRAPHVSRRASSG